MSLAFSFVPVVVVSILLLPLCYFELFFCLGVMKNLPQLTRLVLRSDVAADKEAQPKTSENGHQKINRETVINHATQEAGCCDKTTKCSFRL